jgi:riboflavin synthase
VEVRTDGEWRVRLLLPGDLGIHAVDKGSIALDGVSLTIARVEDAPGDRQHGSVIDVCLIPETLARTNLAARKPGDRVNVEVDYLAKLVARQLEWMKQR